MSVPTPAKFAKMKAAGERIAALTAYDASFAKLVHGAGCDTVLVGDSLGMVIQGRETTIGVSVRDVAYHVGCVTRGAPDLHVIADMPFGSFEAGPERAFSAAARLLAAGAHMVKLEGGSPRVAETVRHLTERGVPVCGHVGLLPQSALATGYRVQGESGEEADRILGEAQAIDEAGASLMVLEKIPAGLAGKITRSVAAATLGIGAGKDCDGQILVLYDVIGLYPKAPRFARDFSDLEGGIEGWVKAYVQDVKEGRFPAAEETPA